jgi:hypothetical protein
MAGMKILRISAKCSDMFSATLIDEKGKAVADYNGYVPDFFPENGGDYIELDIELATGKILNWKVPAENEVNEIFEKDEEQE